MMTRMLLDRFIFLPQPRRWKKIDPNSPPCSCCTDVRNHGHFQRTALESFAVQFATQNGHFYKNQRYSISVSCFLDTQDLLSRPPTQRFTLATPSEKKPQNFTNFFGSECEQCITKPSGPNNTPRWTPLFSPSSWAEPLQAERHDL